MANKLKARKKEKVGKIYVLKNSKNDKVYIGQTTYSLKERFYHHITASKTEEKMIYSLYIAMNEMGLDNFRIELLEDNVPLNKLDERERFYIEKFDSYKNGYNQTSGGKGGKILTSKEELNAVELGKNGESAQK